MAAQSVAVLSIFLLLVPALGPQLDHHFAERRPDHSHVYLGAPSPEHSHPFETISTLMAPFIIICFDVNYPAGSTPILTFPLRGKGLLR